jgi:hypothetical protein
MGVRWTLIVAPLMFVFALVTFSGCGEDTSEAAPLAGPLTYVRSGGFAGETVELTIEPDGRGTVTSDLSGQDSARSFELTDSERERIVDLVEEADVATLEPRKTPPVADGYQFELTFDGRTVRWEMDGTPERAGELVRLLGELAEQHRP